MLQPHRETWPRPIIRPVVALAYCFFYGRKHSLMNPDSPRHGERVELPHEES